MVDSIQNAAVYQMFRSTFMLKAASNSHTSNAIIAAHTNNPNAMIAQKITKPITIATDVLFMWFDCYLILPILVLDSQIYFLSLQTFFHYRYH